MFKPVFNPFKPQAACPLVRSSESRAYRRSTKCLLKALQWFVATLLQCHIHFTLAKWLLHAPPSSSSSSF